jgi:hypothetical protein
MIRRRFITEPRYQRGFTLSLLRGFALAVLLPACVSITAYLAAARHAEPARQAALLAALPGAVGWFALATVALTGVTVLIGIYLSHKYVGPLQRVEAWSARFLLGQAPEKLTLRPGDELADVASALVGFARAGKDGA